MKTAWLIIVALAVGFLAGWYFGYSPASPGSSSAGRWIMTGPGNMILLNTRTGDTWRYWRNPDKSEGVVYLTKPPVRPFRPRPQTP